MYLMLLPSAIYILLYILKTLAEQCGGVQCGEKIRTHNSWMSNFMYLMLLPSAIYILLYILTMLTEQT